MKMQLFPYLRMVLTAVVCCASFTAANVWADTGVWKTAYYKRGFVGNYQSGWAGGLDASILARTPLAFGGTQAQVSVQGCWDQTTNLNGMSLVRGSDNVGHTQGDEYAVTFAGNTTLSLAPGLKTAVSDLVTAPLSQGTWYVKDRYIAATAPAYFPYAYDVDNEYLAGNLGSIAGVRTGVTNRVDVLTADPRSSIVCYGDSITAGYNSTPNAGHRYPDILSTQANRPVLNLGVNGDQLVYAGGSSTLIDGLKGVGSVVYLMGINDLINGTITSQTAYTNMAQSLITQNHASGRKVYWGTILPAGGYANFDNDPNKETLREAINTWIRTQSGADGIIDFDQALRDPLHPTKLLTQYQSGDWLHPNDLGYQVMGQTAAAAVPEPASLALLGLGVAACLLPRC